MANEHPTLDSGQGDTVKYTIRKSRALKIIPNSFVNDFPSEHSISDKTKCQRAACKRSGIPILRGELRFGTWSDNDYFQAYTWKHWYVSACALISIRLADTILKALRNEIPDQRLQESCRWRPNKPGRLQKPHKRSARPCSQCV